MPAVGTDGQGIAEVISIKDGTFTDKTVTELVAGQTGAAGAIAATLAALAGKFTYIAGFEVTGGGATVGAIITVTVTGLLGGTMSYKFAVPAGALLGATPLIVEFTRPLPSVNINTAIVVNVPSFGAGNTDAAVVVHGFNR